MTMTALLQDTNIWVVFSSVLFLAVFIKFGWKVAMGMLDAGIDKIRDNLAQAEKLRLEAEAMMADYQARHRDAMKEAEDIIARAHAQAQTIRAKAEDDLKATLIRREKQLEDRLARTQAEAEAELRAHTASLALKASEALILKSLDKKGQAALVSQSIDAIEKAA